MRQLLRLGCAALLFCIASGVAIVTTPGCGCYRAGCLPAFELKVVPKDGSFPPGENLVVVDFDGRSERCPFTWPVPATNRTGTLAVDCSSDRVLLKVFDGDEPSVVATFLNDRATPALVKVRYSGGPIAAEREFVPKYEEKEVNGSGCTVCKTAPPETWTIP